MCAGGRRPAREPSALRASLGASSRSPARPRHRPPAPRQVPPACCLWSHGCSGRRRPRPPARLGDLTAFGAAPRSPPVPSGPSGALHTSGAGLLIGGSARRRETQLWLSTRNFARNSSMTHSNIEFASVELQRFWGVSKNDHDKLRAKFGWRWCCRCPWVSQPGFVDQVDRLSEALSPLLACARVALKPASPLLARARVGLKPMSPLRAAAEPRMKPASPLRVRNGRFGCVFRLQR